MRLPSPGSMAAWDNLVGLLFSPSPGPCPWNDHMSGFFWDRAGGRWVGHMVECEGERSGLLNGCKGMWGQGSNFYLISLPHQFHQLSFRTVGIK